MNNTQPIRPISLPLPTEVTSPARPKTGPVEGDRLREASEEFEAVFVSYLLKVMRSTVEPADAGAESAMGKDIYLQLFDDEIARNIARTRSFGLGDMLYRQLKAREEASPALPPELPAISPVQNGRPSR